MKNSRSIQKIKSYLALPIAALVCGLFLLPFLTTSLLANELRNQDSFERLIGKVRSTYADDFQAIGKKLQPAPNWDDPRTGAYVHANGNLLIIDIYGGLYRLKGMTDDAFSLAICHEIGHRLGGAPVMWDRADVSVEGQADYFSTLQCARRIWADENSAEILDARTKRIPKFVQSKCEEKFLLRSDQAICERSIQAALDLETALKNEEVNAEPALTLGEHRLPEVEETLLNWWPAYQCRLDTMVAGALCDAKGSLSWKDPNAGACADGNGARPRCWFNPLRFTR